MEHMYIQILHSPCFHTADYPGRLTCTKTQYIFFLFMNSGCSVGVKDYRIVINHKLKLFVRSIVLCAWVVE